MEYTVTVIEVTRSVRKVDANGLKELEGKLKEDGKYVGSCVEQESHYSTTYQIQDIEGRTYPEIKETN